MANVIRILKVNMSTIKKIVLLIFPLLVTPVFGFLIAENHLSFGGGDKDIVILVPWVVWSLLFIVTGMALWKKVPKFKVWALKSFLYSVVILLTIWLCMLFYSVIATK